MFFIKRMNFNFIRSLTFCEFFGVGTVKFFILRKKIPQLIHIYMLVLENVKMGHVCSWLFVYTRIDSSDWRDGERKVKTLL